MPTPCGILKLTIDEPECMESIAKDLVGTGLWERIDEQVGNTKEIG